MKERYSFRLEKQLIDKLVENFPNTPKAQSVSNAIMHYLNADDSKEINNKTAYSINQFQKKYEESIIENQHMQDKITRLTDTVLELNKTINCLLDRQETDTKEIKKQEQEHYDSLHNFINSGFKTTLDFSAKTLYNTQYSNQILYKDVTNVGDIEVVSLTNLMSNSMPLSVINGAINSEMDKDRERRIKQQQL
ncbi:hypothetical protein [Lactococcus lactis]|uniref:hypothetical protein n=1 Tax=Lactococcus lactis TaxID=1358 RepID=UPI0025A13236|nr:hypothetical protein [Lactococcus lactis]MDM7659986.1 hypothetical protein [Lactococcus lactis]